MKRVVAFIMAGGKGERLYPLTKDRAKPAVPFGGTYRIIDFTLSNCVNSGVRKIHVLTQYKAISLARHLRMGWNIFSGELGEYIDVIPAQQRVGTDWYRGTADSIYQNIYTIEMEKPDLVLVLAGDHVYRMDYAAMVEWHGEQRADVTVGVVEVERERAGGLGIVEVGEDRRLLGFREKPQDLDALATPRGTLLASMGIYVFDRDVLERELTADAAAAASTHDFGKDVLPGLIHRARVLAYAMPCMTGEERPYWRDIGTRDAYYEANMDLVAVSPPCNLYDLRWPVRTYQEQWPPVKTVFASEREGRLGSATDSVISGGCIISGGRVEHSVLSPNVRVHSFSHVKDSVIMEGVQIGRHARIQRAIIDKDVSIPPGMTIGCDAEQDRKRFAMTTGGVVVVPKGTVFA